MWFHDIAENNFFNGKLHFQETEKAAVKHYKHCSLWWLLSVFSGNVTKSIPTSIRFSSNRWCSFATLRNLTFPWGKHGSAASQKVNQKYYKHCRLWSVLMSFSRKGPKGETETNTKIAFGEWDFSQSENICFAEENEGFLHPTFVHFAQNDNNNTYNIIYNNGNDFFRYYYHM